MSKKRHYEAAPRVIEEVEVDNAAPVEVEVDAEPEVVAAPPKTGVVVCKLLNIRKEPNVFASVLCTVAANEKIEVYDTVGDFYKVCTSAGIEGYSMKQFISVQ